MRSLAPALLSLALVGAAPALANPGAQPTVAATVSSARAPIQTFYAALAECMKAGPSLDLEGRRAKLTPVIECSW